MARNRVGGSLRNAAAALIAILLPGAGLLGAGSAIRMDQLGSAITSASFARPAHAATITHRLRKPRLSPGSKQLLFDGFYRYPYPAGETWTDGDTFGPWRVVFAGFGRVGPSASTPGALELEPGVARSPDETHSTLVVSRRNFGPPCMRVTARVRTLDQLREGSPPSPWETAWLVWDYRDNDHFSYLALKTNGWELGKRDPAYTGGQRFLATGNAPPSVVGAWQDISITRSARGKRSTVLVIGIDGNEVARFADTERPYRKGAVGLYAEDAVVQADTIAAYRCTW